MIYIKTSPVIEPLTGAFYEVAKLEQGQNISKHVKMPCLSHLIIAHRKMVLGNFILSVGICPIMISQHAEYSPAWLSSDTLIKW